MAQHRTSTSLGPAIATAMKATQNTKTLALVKKWSGRTLGPFVKWTIASVTINKRTHLVTENWIGEAVDMDLTAMKAMKAMKVMKTAMKAMKVMKAMKAKK